MNFKKINFSGATQKDIADFKHPFNTLSPKDAQDLNEQSKHASPTRLIRSDPPVPKIKFRMAHPRLESLKSLPEAEHALDLGKVLVPAPIFPPLPDAPTLAVPVERVETNSEYFLKDHQRVKDEARPLLIFTSKLDARRMEIWERDLATLLPSRWLNDTIIDFDLLRMENEMSTNQESSVLVLDSFFWSFMGKEETLNWSKNPFLYDIVIFPICEQ